MCMRVRIGVSARLLLLHVLEQRILRFFSFLPPRRQFSITNPSLCSLKFRKRESITFPSMKKHSRYGLCIIISYIYNIYIYTSR